MRIEAIAIGNNPPEDINVIIEVPVGGASANFVDPVTLTEVSIVGNPAAGEAALRRAAIRKLEYVMERDGARPATGQR